MGIVIGKGESCASALVLVVGLHGILQAAGLPHDGHCAVAQSHELAQTAGLKEGRHKEGIAGRVDLVGHGLRVIDLSGYPVMVLPIIVAEHVLVALIARAENHQLHIIAAQLIHHALDQVEALLIRQAGYNAHHKLLLIHRQPQLSLEGLLILRLLDLASLLVITFESFDAGSSNNLTPMSRIVKLFVSFVSSLFTIDHPTEVVPISKPIVIFSFFFIKHLSPNKLYNINII